ncbi:ATP-dependent RNA helicase vasa, isoform A, partial [Ophiophagus hannah]
MGLCKCFWQVWLVSIVGSGNWGGGWQKRGLGGTHSRPKPPARRVGGRKGSPSTNWNSCCQTIGNPFEGGKEGRKEGERGRKWEQRRKKGTEGRKKGGREGGREDEREGRNDGREERRKVQMRED